MSGQNPTRTVFRHVHDGGRTPNPAGRGGVRSVIGDPYHNLLVNVPARKRFSYSASRNFVVDKPINNRLLLLCHFDIPLLFIFHPKVSLDIYYLVSLWFGIICNIIWPCLIKFIHLITYSREAYSYKLAYDSLIPALRKQDMTADKR